MKTFLATFVAASAAALSLATAPSARPNPTGDSAECPPTVFECCDGTQNTNCNANGGNCGVISVCGKPF